MLDSRNSRLATPARETMKLGYATVPSGDGETEMQIIKDLAGANKIFIDKVREGPLDRLRFREMLEAARTGDCIVIPALHHLAGTSFQLRVVLANLERRRLWLTSVADRLVEISPANIFPAFQAIANFESKCSYKPGLAAARALGRVGGRKPVLTREKKEILDQLLEQSDDLSAHAHVIGVSVRTVRRYATGDYTN